METALLRKVAGGGMCVWQRLTVLLEDHERQHATQSQGRKGEKGRKHRNEEGMGKEYRRKGERDEDMNVDTGKEKWREIMI